MVRIGQFEVTVLTSTEGQARHLEWTPAKEYRSPNRDTYEKGCYASKYIVAPEVTDSNGNVVPTAFAIQFKVHGPLSEEFMEGAQLIVFRVYHDDKKIGSSHVKRKDWERSVTYTVRKSSRRFWLQDQGGWISLNWQLDEGLHGQLRVEVWRQIEGRSYSGSWDSGLDIPVTSHEGTDYIDYFDPAVTVPSRATRVRFTKRLNDDPCAQPDAKFVFEYRPEETMRTIGILPTVTSPRKSTPAATVYDLTQDDDVLPNTSNHQQVYDISDCSVASPSKTISSNYTSDDIWSSSSMPTNDSYNGLGPMQYYLPTSDVQIPSIQSSDFYSQECASHGFPISYERHDYSTGTYEMANSIHTQEDTRNLREGFHTNQEATGLTKGFHVQENVIDLTMDD